MPREYPCRDCGELGGFRMLPTSFVKDPEILDDGSQSEKMIIGGYRRVFIHDLTGLHCPHSES